ncbi:MAG: hypothetical protein K5651_04365, partial [Bacteroidales bacterium]|nr:hypothetical protein [Bacteroidales bacterium]
TPSFPLKTDISALSGSFSNNTIVLDSLKVLSGKSDMKFNGKIDGLKRFLASRGPLYVDAQFQSQEIDADELMAA